VPPTDDFKCEAPPASKRKKSVTGKGDAMADANKKKPAATVSINARIICRDCGAFVEITKKPSTVNCPKCGMGFKIAKNFKG
jgi:DNA-directed RNA polymerase subunit RPC12/RpoP